MPSVESNGSGAVSTPVIETHGSHKSAILATLARLTKLWEEEKRAESAAFHEPEPVLKSVQSDLQSPSVARDNHASSRAYEAVNPTIIPGVTTTFMIRNIPLRFTPLSFRELIDEEGFSGRYDYLYMPMDFRSHRSLGYCFLSFLDPSSAVDFASKFSRRTFPSTNSEKVLAISAAARQGQLANVKSFKLSTLKQMPKPEFRPLVGILGQMFPLDERVYDWLIRNDITSAPSSPWGVSPSSTV